MVDEIDSSMNVRINKDDLHQFKAICKSRHKMHYSKMVRLMISAFNDGRMKIEMTPAQKQIYGG